MPINGNALYQNIDLDLLAEGLTAQSVEPWLSPRQAAGATLRLSLLKKHTDEVVNDADAKALAKFLHVNDRCKNWSLSENRDIVQDVILGEIRQNLHDFWYVNRKVTRHSHMRFDGPATCVAGCHSTYDVSSLCDNPYFLLEKGRTGPGASVSANGGDFYTKFFSSPISCTKRVLYSMYGHYCSNRRLWAEAEELRSSRFGVQYVDVSLLSFVPKDNTISRTICTEPSLNMYYQLGLESVLKDRLKAWWGINLETQPDVNRRMAIQGSRDDSFSTIDLSSASDSLSLSMLECLLPKQWYELLLLLRTSKTQLPDGSQVDLHMVSTMGNGFTFPMETILFSAVVRSVYKIMGLSTQGELGPTWSVFGDDIIVRREAYRCVVSMLGLLGFQVNEKKSFETGPFKESCGVDAFRGVNIRGVYLQDINPYITHYVIFNRLLAWSCDHAIPIPRTIRYLLGFGNLRVPVWESDDSGYKYPLNLCGELPRNRNGSYLYRKMQVAPKTIRFRGSEVKVPIGMKSRIYNPAGHFLAALHGCCTKDAITVRPKPGETVQYRQREAVAPTWDYALSGTPVRDPERNAWLTTMLTWP